MFGRRKFQASLDEFQSEKFANPPDQVLTHAGHLWMHLRQYDEGLMDALFQLDGQFSRRSAIQERVQAVLDLSDEASFEAALKAMMERWNGSGVPDDERQELEVQVRMVGYVFLHRYGGDPQALLMR